VNSETAVVLLAGEEARNERAAADPGAGGDDLGIVRRPPEELSQGPVPDHRLA
jgi:hypothetical protein